MNPQFLRPYAREFKVASDVAIHVQEQAEHGKADARNAAKTAEGLKRRAAKASSRRDEAKQREQDAIEIKKRSKRKVLRAAEREALQLMQRQASGNIAAVD